MNGKILLKCGNKFHEETAPAKEGEECPTCRHVPNPEPTMALLIARGLKARADRLSIRHPAPPSAIEAELLQVTHEDRVKWQALLEKATEIELGLFELRALRSLAEGGASFGQSRPEVFVGLKKKKFIRIHNERPGVSGWRIEDLGRAMLAVHIMRDDNPEPTAADRAKANLLVARATRTKEKMAQNAAARQASCRNWRHVNRLPVVVAACPDCDALPAISVKGGGPQPVEGFNPEELLEQAAQLEIGEVGLNLLRWVADGGDQENHAQTLYQELQEQRLVYLHEELGREWRITPLGKAVLKVQPPTKSKNPVQFSEIRFEDIQNKLANMLADQGVVPEDDTRWLVDLVNLYRSGMHDDGAETLIAEDRFDGIVDAVYGGALDCEHPDLRADMVWLVEEIQRLTRSLQRKDPTMWSVLDTEFLTVQKERDEAQRKVTSLEAMVSYQRAKQAQLNVELMAQLRVIPEQDKNEGETDNHFWIRVVGEQMGETRQLLTDALEALVAMQREGVMMCWVLPKIRNYLTNYNLPKTNG